MKNININGAIITEDIAKHIQDLENGAAESWNEVLRRSITCIARSEYESSDVRLGLIEEITYLQELISDFILKEKGDRP